ncbi:hypothetical protein HRbin19_00790 [bacterium HR19]|nr:hypothetical protein HRbin19_00790 [bacterium HR19]
MDIEWKVLFILERLWIAFEKVVRDIAIQNNLSPLQAKIITYLLRKGEASIKEVVSEVNVKHSACNSALKALSRKKLIIIYEGKTDRRFKMISLTNAGRELAKSLNWYSVFSESISHLRRSEKHQFLVLLMNLAKLMQEKGLISPQKMCFSCVYFHDMYCLFLKKKLSAETLQVSCPDFKPA